jgi:hypothetical protein
MYRLSQAVCLASSPGETPADSRIWAEALKYVRQGVYICVNLAIVRVENIFVRVNQRIWRRGGITSTDRIGRVTASDGGMRGRV